MKKWVSGGWFQSQVVLVISIVIFTANFNEFKSTCENQEQGFINIYMTGVQGVVQVSLLIAIVTSLGKVLEATKDRKLIAKELARGLSNLVAFSIVIFFCFIFSLLVPSTPKFATTFIAIFTRIAIKTFPCQVTTTIGISILCFIFANGLANFVRPPSATLMGYTSYAKMLCNVWIKEIWKITTNWFILSLFLIVVFLVLVSGG